MSVAKPQVIVTRRLPDAVEARLKQHFEVALNAADLPFSRAQLLAALQTADGLLPTVSDRIDSNLLLAAVPLRTRILANFGVGTNNIDLDPARARGLVVTNTPDVLTEATADIALALMLAVTRRMWEMENQLRRGEWAGFSPSGYLGTGLQAKVLGIIGMGRIGRAVARRAAFGFGMRIVYFNRSPVADSGVPLALARVSIEDVLRESDIVSLHCPGGASNAGLISAERLRLMKPSAFLINTARGDLVDEAALIGALQKRQLAGAGLDVFRNEPEVPEALRRLNNVSLLPHIGSATIETRTAMGMRAVDNLIAFFRGEAPPDRVI